MSKVSQQILELRSKGLTYNEIVDKLGCSKSLVSYHCGKGQKEKSYKRNLKNKSNWHPYQRKLYKFVENKRKSNTKILDTRTIEYQIYKKLNNYFKNDGKNYMSNNTQITIDELINKFGKKPKCYLTGQEIDIYKPKTYEFDHKIPRSKGGDSSIDNLGICTKNANRAKHNLTPDEFIALCKLVAKHNK